MADKICSNVEVEVKNAAISAELRKDVSPNSDMSQYVKLNVGGHLFYTTMDTLTKDPDTMFSAMFSGRLPVLTDPEGWVLIDRSGTHFATILNYLRDRTVVLPDSKKEVLELQAEAKYYCISELISQCSFAAVQTNGLCTVPLITSDAEESLLIRNTTWPVVVFAAHHGERSKDFYTKLRQNEEFFEQLKLRFNDRIFFIKDIRPGSKLSWKFYSRGIATAKVNCVDPHGTAVFPETIISRELLNICEYSVVPFTFTERFVGSLFEHKWWVLGGILGGIILYRRLPN